MRQNLTLIALKAVVVSIHDVWAIFWRTSKDVAWTILRTVRHAAVLAWRGVVAAHGFLANAIHFSFSLSSAISIVILPLMVILDPFGVWAIIGNSIGTSFGNGLRLLLGVLLGAISLMFAYNLARAVKSNWGMSGVSNLQSNTASFTYALSSLLSWICILTFFSYFLVFRLALSIDGPFDLPRWLVATARSAWLEPTSGNQSQPAAPLKEGKGEVQTGEGVGAKSNEFLGRTPEGEVGGLKLVTNRIEYGLIQEVSPGSFYELKTKECTYSGHPYSRSEAAGGEVLTRSKLLVKSGSNCPLPEHVTFRGSRTTVVLEWFLKNGELAYTTRFSM